MIEVYIALALFVTVGLVFALWVKPNDKDKKHSTY